MLKEVLRQDISMQHHPIDVSHLMCSFVVNLDYFRQKLMRKICIVKMSNAFEKTVFYASTNAA